MLFYALFFFLVALLAGILGFGALAGPAATIAKLCFLLFLVLSFASLFRGRRT